MDPGRGGWTNRGAAGHRKAEAGKNGKQSSPWEKFHKSGCMLAAGVQVSSGLLEDCFQNNLQQEGKIQKLQSWRGSCEDLLGRI